MLVDEDNTSLSTNSPFYVNKFGWTLAGSLKAGDVLVLSNGEFVTVEWIQHEILESPIKVYNFEVEEFHTYFVGECGVLVHNDCTYSRVQGGDEGTNNFSKETIKVNTDGSIYIIDKNSDLYISIGNEHAEYFLGIRGDNAYIVQFDLPDWVDETIAYNGRIL